MRRTFLLLLITGLLLPLETLYGQAPGKEAFEELSKDERKKWKKVAKTYKRNPVRLKILSEEHAYYRQQSSQIQNEMEQLEAENARLSRTNASLEMEVGDLRAQVQELEAALREQPAEPEPPLDTDAIVMGIVFKVQIGAYQKRGIADDLVTSENLKTESSDSVQKILVGQFREYDKAQKLRDQLRAMGVKDAWVVSYRDGERVPIEEVIPGAGG